MGCTLHFDGLLLSKSYKISAKKYRIVISHDTEEKLTCGFKYDMRNLVNVHPTTQKSENLTLMSSFCLKYIRFELKKYRRVVFHDTEQ